MAGNITREELKAKMDRDNEFVLVDTLGEDSYRQSHLPGAINLPLEEITGPKRCCPTRRRR